MGLKSNDPAIRNKFFQLFDTTVEKTLLARVNCIFTIQNWELMGNTFWIKQALDLLLSVFVENRTSSNSEFTAVISEPKKKTRGAHANQKYNSMKLQTDAFIKRLQENPSNDFLPSLRELFYQDTMLAYKLWVQLFPMVWSSLSSEEQKSVSKTLGQFLSKEYNKKQRVHPNAIQPILEGISLCKPAPLLSQELIKFLGKTYNLYHVSIKMIENHILSHPEEDHGHDLSLAELYQLLNQQDLFYAIWRKRATYPETTKSLTLEQYGFWRDSQQSFQQAMELVRSGTAKPPPSSEGSLWQEGWLQSAKHLNQWEVVSEFATQCGHSDLVVETAWKVGDWISMREALNKLSNSEVVHTKIFQAYTSIHEGSL